MRPCHACHARGMSRPGASRSVPVRRSSTLRYTPAHRSIPVLGTGAAALLIALAQTSSSLAAQAASPASTGHAAQARTLTVPAVKPVPTVSGHIDTRTLVSPLPTSQCVSQIGIHCYSPLQYRTAYDLDPLYKHHVTGAGRTILIVDSFGSPTIQNDLQVFDAQWGIPDTTVHIVKA